MANLKMEARVIPQPKIEDELVPVDRSSLSQRVTELIRRAIVSGVLLPAEPITLREVARRLGVSPTPVREALSHLGAVGLVQSLSGRIRIAEATPSAIEDAFTLREALDGMTARLAALRRTEDEIVEIREMAESSVRAVNESDAETFRAVDMEFHRRIVKAAHSQQLGCYARNALDLALTLRNVRTHGRRLRGDFAAMHISISDAIENREADTAESIAREHVRKVKALIQSDPASGPEAA